MVGSEKDGSNKQTTGNDAQEEASIYGDEINLIDYFLVLWKHKFLILLCSVLPALAVGLVLFFSPRNYKVTYVYDIKDQGGYDVGNWNLNESNYKILLDRFYSAENTDKIATKLQGNGLNKYAERINTGGLKNFVDFEVSPSYIDLSKVSDLTQVEQIRQLEAQLLNMTITGRPENDISRISSVMMDNFENVIPVYMVQNQLSATIRGYRSGMADIEGNKFNLELSLKADITALEKLKNVKTRVPERAESDVTLQFDIGGRSEYLPLGYQIQAVESKIVMFEKQVKINEAKYKYYKDLSALNEKLFAELKNGISSYYTIQQFHSFLTGLIDNYEAVELKDYLASYIKRIENRISASTPVSENPEISSIAKGTKKKVTIVFAAALMMSVFAAFLLESLKESRIRLHRS